jgi:signal transduction histidine kinase
MQHEVERLEQVVRDFSNLAKEPSIAPQRTPLSGLIDHVVTLFRPLAQQRGIALYAHVLGAETAAHVDPQRIEQVLINLVKNAIEATPARGKVEISTKVEDGRLIVEVADSGSGIAPDQQPLIFEPFHSTRSHGLGLGLFLSKRLVDAHGGVLTMTSSPGKGTTFRISLPIPAAAV